jgi:hypothetical protein
MTEQKNEPWMLECTSLSRRTFEIITAGFLDALSFTFF